MAHKLNDFFFKIHSEDRKGHCMWSSVSLFFYMIFFTRIFEKHGSIARSSIKFPKVPLVTLHVANGLIKELYLLPSDK